MTNTTEPQTATERVLSTDEIDGRIRNAFDDLRRIINLYESESFRVEPPFIIHSIPDRIKLRLRLIRDLQDERMDIRREMQRRDKR